MPRFGLFPLFAVAVLALSSAGASPALEQSISASRQFIVYGTDVAVRGAICDFAERTKRELLTLLGQRDNFATAIVINAQYPRANLPELPRLNVDLGQTGFGLKFQLDLVIDSAVTRPEIRRELLRALILEMIYRGQPNIAAGTSCVSPPDWFLDGVPPQPSEESRDRMAAILAVPVATRTVLPLEKLLEERPDLLDAPGQRLYGAYALALVDLLSRSPNGSQRLAKFIFDLPFSSNDAMAELTNHFPGLFGSDGGKTWQECIVHFSRDQPYQLLGSSETERRLDEVLRIRISDRGAEKNYELNQFAAFLKAKSGRTALVALRRDLENLATRAHPLYAPIIAEYSEITSLIRRGKTLDVGRRLERLGNLRKTMKGQMSEIDDYLNWFEATNMVQPSGEFTDYLEAAKRATEPVQTKRDPISVYLDSLETQLDESHETIR